MKILVKKCMIVTAVFICIHCLFACSKESLDIEKRINQTLKPYLDTKGFHYQVKEKEITITLEGDNDMVIFWGEERNEFTILLTNFCENKEDYYKNIPYEMLSEIVGCLSERKLPVKSLKEIIENKEKFYNNANSGETPKSGYYIMKKTHIFDFLEKYKVYYDYEESDQRPAAESVWYIENLTIVWHT